MVSSSAIATLVVFLLSIVCVIRPFSIPIFGHKFPINLTTAPIIAILILWAAQCLVAKNVSLESNQLPCDLLLLLALDSRRHCVSYTQDFSIVNHPRSAEVQMVSSLTTFSSFSSHLLTWQSHWTSLAYCKLRLSGLATKEDRMAGNYSPTFI